MFNKHPPKQNNISQFKRNMYRNADKRFDFTLKIKFYICLKFKRKNGRLITFSHQTHRKLQIGHGNRNTVHCTNVLSKYCVT